MQKSNLFRIVAKNIQPCLDNAEKKPINWCIWKHYFPLLYNEQRLENAT